MEITYLGGLHTSKLIEDAFKEYYKKVLKSLHINEEGLNFVVYQPYKCGVILSIEFINNNSKLPTFDINGNSYEIDSKICEDYIERNDLFSAEIKDVFEAINDEIVLK